MTLLVVVYTKEGIVMASDSRVTYSTNHPVGETVNNISVHFADTTYKTFVSENNVGISIAGDSSINNSSITGYIEEFIRLHPKASVDEIPDLLLNHFKTINPLLNTTFHVAGYAELNDQQRVPKVYHIHIREGKIEEVDTKNSGAVWSGEGDVLGKLVKPVYDEDKNPLPHYEIPWPYVTLQDAVDFAKYAIQTTIDTMRFQNRPQTVGGPIDILLIRPNGSEWLARKEIHS